MAVSSVEEAVEPERVTVFDGDDAESWSVILFIVTVDAFTVSLKLSVSLCVCIFRTQLDRTGAVVSAVYEVTFIAVSPGMAGFGMELIWLSYVSLIMSVVILI